MKVGYCFANYPSKRNIIDRVPQAKYVKIFDIYSIASHVPLFVNKKIVNQQFFTENDFFQNFNDYFCSFNDFSLNHLDLVHLFNSVSFCKTPWITTFETMVPRFKSTLSCHHGPNSDYSSLLHDRKIHKALRALAGDSCKKLIAMSECSANIEKYFLSHFPEYQDKIEDKLTVLHPSQRHFIDKIEKKQIDSDRPMHFVFVGSAFFRKGGKEVLYALSESRKRNGYNIKLTIVSSLKIDDYATGTNYQDVQKMKHIIKENSDWIDYFYSLPNEQVIEVMKKADVGLLPTYADTYGYVMLEYQAAGCPVISTNVRALPEINNSDIGWIIEIPKNKLGEAIHSTKENRMEISRAIIGGIEVVVEEIMENKNIVQRKAETALQNIKTHHTPKAFSQQLSEIYSEAVQ